MYNKSLKKISPSKYVLIFGLSAAPFGSATALEYSGDFSLPTSINYDSNIQMSSSNDESVSFYNLNPRLDVSANDDVNAINLNASVLFQRSSDERISEDRKDPTLGLSWVRSFERGQFSLATNYNKMSTRVSERRTTGQIFNDGSSTNRSIDAGISYLITEKFNLATGVGYQETRFSGANLNDFQSRTFNTKLSYLYSEKLTPFLEFSIGRFENESNNLVLDGLDADRLAGNGTAISRNFLAGFNYKVNSRLDYSLAAGVNRVSSAGSGWVGNAALNYLINDQSSLIGTVGRNVSPTGLGGFLEIDNLALTYMYDIDQKNHLGANASWTITRDVIDSDFRLLGGFYGYDLTKDWGLRSYVNYRTLETNSDKAHAYLIGFSITYNHPNLF